MKKFIQFLNSYGQIFAGTVVAIIGLFVMLGWFFSFEAWIRINPRYSAMVFNTALCFFLIGMGLICAELSLKRTLRVIVAFVFGMSILTIVEYLFHVNLYLDEFFLKYNLSATMTFPGRMALNTAVCFFASSLILLAYTLKNKLISLFSVLFISSFILGIAGSGLIGYLAGAEEVAGWVSYSRMAFHTAFCFALFSFATFLKSIINTINLRISHFVFPFAGMVSSFIFTASIWKTIQSDQYVNTFDIAKVNERMFRFEVTERLKEYMLAIQRQGDRFSNFGGTPENLWQEDVSNYLKDFSALNQVSFFDENFQLIKEMHKVNYGDLPLEVLSSENLNSIKLFHSYIQFDPSKAVIFIYIPQKKKEVFNGILVATVDAKKLIGNVLNLLVFPAYEICILSKDTIFFEGGIQFSNRVGSALESNMEPFLPWKIQFYVTDMTLALSKSNFHYFILLAGIGISCLIGVALYFGAILLEKKKYIEVKNILLKRASEKANQATLAKGLFLANMSHEIRTPLNASLGTLQLLEETQVDELQKKYIDRINTSNKLLLTLINDILTFSKIESGSISLEVKDVNLEVLSKSALQGVFHKAQEKKITLILDFPPCWSQMIRGDEHRILQIITNLVNNSIKFTDAGSITVRIVFEGDPVVTRIEVIDTGIGIDPSDQTKLFQKFSQIDDGSSRKFGGVGLGLSICKKLVEMMRGQIGVHSEKGKGACFWVELPLELGPKIDDSIRKFTPGQKVNLFDSDEKEKEILEKMLKEWGLEVGFEKSDEAQLIISSDMLTETQIKPIILIVDQELKEKKEGIVSSLVRPLSPTDVFQTVKNVLKR